MYQKLKSILVDDLQLMEADIRPEATLKEAGLDSLALVELSLVLSKRHSIEVSDDELDETATVADIADLLTQRAFSRPPQTTG